MDSQQRLGDAVVRVIIDGYEYVSARSVHTLPARTHDKLVVPESHATSPRLESGSSSVC